MVGITVLGDGKLNAKTLPPEARALNRLCRLLDNSTEIQEALLDVLRKAPQTSEIVSIRNMVDSIIEPLKAIEYRKDKLFEHKLALGTNIAIVTAFQNSGDDWESLASPAVKTSTQQHLRHENNCINMPSITDERDQNSQDRKNEKRWSIPPAGGGGKASIAVVSETESEGGSDQSDAPITMSDFWAYLLEGLHLQVVSRTTRVWGRKKIYEIYRLSGPASSSKSLEQIRRDLQREFQTAYSGIDSRTYALKRDEDGYLFLHLVIGKPFDYSDERNRAASGEKKKKKANEFIFIVQPGSSLIAVSASRAPSKSRFVKYVLTAVDLALATSEQSQGVQRASYEAPVRVGDSSSTEPMELLQAARASETGEATGRFSYIATHDVESDPLTEMQEVSAASVMDRTSEDARLQISSEHGRQAGQEYLEAIENCENTGGALAASSDAGVIIDHEASLREKRLRLRGSIFGEGGPRLKKLRFKWTGETLATSDVWGAQSNRSAKCKCTFSFRGSHALEGLREMVDLGVFQAPLPSFILDAPLAGTSTIVIRDGAIVKEK